MNRPSPGPPAGAVVALVGPTASGKSAAAMDAARALDGRVEIVAIDAFTVYRGMDIGTATPPPQDRTAVPHHMVDVLEPEQECTVQWFQASAREAIAEVHDRGRVPLLVGGSGLYFRAVVDPLEFPPTDPEVRAEVTRRWAADPAAAHRHLATLDPAAAGRIEPDNVRRTVRALEVIELTGRPFSAFRTAWDRHASIYPGLTVFGVDIARPALGAALEARTQRMLAAGWLEEVRALRGRDLSDSARQAIGYAELLAHLDGTLDLPTAVERIVVRTRQFATRQQRWFAGDPRVDWTPPGALAERLLVALAR